MDTFIRQAQLYATYHQKPLSRYTDFVGVPLIVFSTMIFFGFIHLVVPGVLNITLAGIATLALLGYYFYLNWRLALALTVVFLVMLGIAHLVSRHGPNSTSLWIFFITFILGWTLQIIGHFIEGNHPAFIDNLWQALCAPMFIAAEVFFLMGYMHPLKMEIEGETRLDDTL